MIENKQWENDEEYALKRIAEEYDETYLKMDWNRKSDDYDFTGNDCALEITSVRSNELIEVKRYENAKDKKGCADVSKIAGAIEIDSEGKVRKFWGGSLTQYRNKCIESIRNKNNKVIKRMNIGQKYKRNELCLCIYEAPFFSNLIDLEFLKEEFEKSIFDRLLIVTRDRVLVME